MFFFIFHDFSRTIREDRAVFYWMVKKDNKKVIKIFGRMKIIRYLCNVRNDKVIF